MQGCEPGSLSCLSCPHCAFAGGPAPMGSSWSPGTPGSPRPRQRVEEEEEEEEEDGSRSGPEEASDSEGEWFLEVRGL